MDGESAPWLGLDPVRLAELAHQLAHERVYVVSCHVDRLGFAGGRCHRAPRRSVRRPRLTPGSGPLVNTQPPEVRMDLAGIDEPLDDLSAGVGRRKRGRPPRSYAGHQSVEIALGDLLATADQRGPAMAHDDDNGVLGEDSGRPKRAKLSPAHLGIATLSKAVATHEIAFSQEFIRALRESGWLPDAMRMRADEDLRFEAELSKYFLDAWREVRTHGADTSRDKRFKVWCTATEKLYAPYSSWWSSHKARMVKRHELGPAAAAVVRAVSHHVGHEPAILAMNPTVATSAAAAAAAMSAAMEVKPDDDGGYDAAAALAAAASGGSGAVAASHAALQAMVGVAHHGADPAAMSTLMSLLSHGGPIPLDAASKLITSDALSKALAAAVQDPSMQDKVGGFDEPLAGPA